MHEFGWNISNKKTNGPTHEHELEGCLRHSIKYSEKRDERTESGDSKPISHPNEAVQEEVRAVLVASYFLYHQKFTKNKELLKIKLIVDNWSSLASKQNKRIKKDSLLHKTSNWQIMVISHIPSPFAFIIYILLPKRHENSLHQSTPWWSPLQEKPW